MTISLNLTLTTKTHSVFDMCNKKLLKNGLLGNSKMLTQQQNIYINVYTLLYLYLSKLEQIKTDADVHGNQSASIFHFQSLK